MIHSVLCSLPSLSFAPNKNKFRGPNAVLRGAILFWHSLATSSFPHSVFPPRTYNLSHYLAKVPQGCEANRTQGRGLRSRWNVETNLATQDPGCSRISHVKNVLFCFASQHNLTTSREVGHVIMAEIADICSAYSHTIVSWQPTAFPKREMVASSRKRSSNSSLAESNRWLRASRKRSTRTPNNVTGRIPYLNSGRRLHLSWCRQIGWHR